MGQWMVGQIDQLIVCVAALSHLVHDPCGHLLAQTTGARASENDSDIEHRGVPPSTSKAYPDHPEAIRQPRGETARLGPSPRHPRPDLQKGTLICAISSLIDP